MAQSRAVNSGAEGGASRGVDDAVGDRMPGGISQFSGVGTAKVPSGVAVKVKAARRPVPWS